MSDDKLSKRVESLEEKVAFQERTIEDLSEAVNGQWKLLETFKREVSRLNDELKAVEDNLSRGGEREPPPPHY